MKKLSSLLLGAVMSLSLCLPALSACGNDENVPHEHTVTTWTQVKAPTCTEEGLESGVCTECGETVTQKKDPLGHTILRENVQEFVSAATCTEAGLWIVYCPVCKQNVEDKIPALGHAWVNDEVYLTEPTCTEEGSVHATCSRCSAEDVRTVPALGHEWETFYTIETAATFDHDGLKYQKCSRCAEKHNETVIPKLDPNEPTQFEFRLVRRSGEIIKFAGVRYEIIDKSGKSVGTGSFRSGSARVALLPAEYTLKITALPKGYAAQESYEVSWENLVADIPLTASLIMEQPAADTKYALNSVMNDLTFHTIATNARAAEDVTLSGLLSTHKIVILNFWDTSCSFCQYEFPGLVAAYDQYKEDVAVIAIDDPDGMNGIETEAEVRAYANKQEMTFYVAMDREGLAERFGVAGYPMTVVIDAEGTVAYIHDGAFVNPNNYSDVAYSTAQCEALFQKYTSSPYYQA